MLVKEQILEVFKELNQSIEKENIQRQSDGRRVVQKSRIEILGQTSLLIQPDLTFHLQLAQTGDLIELFLMAAI